MHEPTTTPSTPTLPTIAVLLRVHWMFAGYATLVILSMLMLREGDPILSGRGIAVIVVAITMILARYINITRYGGLTADGEPANMRHLVQYAATVLLLTGAVLAAVALF